MNLSDFDTLTFDCYGTLIDWESGIWDGLQPLLMANGKTDITRERGLRDYARVESSIQSEAPGLFYPALLEKVHARLADDWGLSTNDAMNGAFGSSIPHWPAFPDTADALRVLKKHFKLVILSNVNRSGFEASNRKLGVAFDAIITAEDAGSYKPNLRHFELMLDTLSNLGTTKDKVLHTAQSLYHDHVPATSFGLAKCWIDRQNLAETDNWGATATVDERPEVDFRFRTMGEMAAAWEVG